MTRLSTERAALREASTRGPRPAPTTIITLERRGRRREGIKGGGEEGKKREGGRGGGGGKEVGRK